MSTANLTREETAARAAGISLETVEVDLDLRAARERAEDRFPVVATLSFSATTADTWIDFLGASVDEVVVNGEVREVDWDGARIRIDRLAASNRVTVRGHGTYSSSGEGLHRFVDPADGATYLYTQYEPADARRVYPCFEQPDLKARWRFTVTGPEGWEILTGGAETGRDAVDGGVRVRFAETLPLSSYITAVAAGPYHRVDGSWERDGQRVALGVLCRASLAEHLDAAEIFDITRRGLDFYTAAFDYPYPWGKYDQIFVPEYNLGAMENPGLVTFTERYVFRGKATTAQHEQRAGTILHEMAHMWFGDLVTMRWWDDLWLKESFADFMGTHANVETGLHPDAWVSFASRRKAWAYEQDQLPTTHPIVADIPDLEAAKLNFDGITYAKGASVLKQLVAFVGEDAFFRGAQRYFAAHAFGNTTLADLLAALEDASGRDLRTWSDAWLRTTGLSELRVERAQPADLTQTDPRPHRLTVGFYRGGGDLRRAGGLTVDLETATEPLTVPPETDLIIPNDDDLTYAKVRLDAASLAAVRAGLSTLADPLARAVVWAALWNAVRDGRYAVTDYVALTQQHAPGETHIALLGDAISNTGTAIARYADSAAHDRLAAGRLQSAWDFLQSAAPGSDAQLAWARAVGSAAAISDGRAEQIAAILRGTATPPEGLRLDPDLRWQWLIAISATGHAEPADLEAELQRDASASGRTAALTVRGAVPDREVRAAGWRAAWEDRSLSNDHLDAVIAGVRAGDRRDLIAAFDADYFARILPTWQERSIEIARRLVRGLFPASESLEPVDAWLATHPGAPGALRRIVVEQRDGLARSLRVRGLQASLRRA